MWQKWPGFLSGQPPKHLTTGPMFHRKTCSRVIDAATVLGYHKISHNHHNENAISVIGMLVKHDYGLDDTVNPFYSHVERGVERECRKRNISLMYSAVEVDHKNRPVIWPSMISEQRIDGLLLIGTFIEDTIDLIQGRINIPIVLIDSYAANLSLDSVLIDNTEGASSAVNHLIGFGHRYIGLLGSNMESPPGVFERRISYQKAMQKVGIQDEYIGNSELNRGSAYQATQLLLQRCPQITAIFSVNDDSAIGVMNAIHDMGRSIPEDISVIGFDNIDVAKEVHPRLAPFMCINPGWVFLVSAI